MWVQVPPLAPPDAPGGASPARDAARRGRSALARRGALGLAGTALVTALLACAPRFESTVSVGPPDGVIARATGSAASIAVGRGEALIAFAARGAGAAGSAEAERGERIWIGRWTSRGPGAAEPYGPASKERPGAPLALARDGDNFAVAWREPTGGSERRLAWMEVAPAGVDAETASELAKSIAADPRGGGAPPALLAAVGPPPRPGEPIAVPLAAWLFGPSGERPERFDVGRGRPLGYQILGLPGAEGPRALAATLDAAGRLVLTRLAGNAPSEAFRIEAQPAGPRPVWLGRAADGLVAAWSEHRAGSSGRGSVRLTRSLDIGRSWSAPQALFEIGSGVHPMADFSADATAVAAVWREPAERGYRVVLAISRDGAARFTSAVAVDGGGDVAERTTPAVAIRGETVLVTWVERTSSGATAIHASLSRDGGVTFSPRGERLDDAAAGRTVGNPQAWLLDGACGAVLWESRPAAATPTTPPFAGAAEPARLSLHVRGVQA